MSWESVPATLGCPQLVFVVEKGNVEAPNMSTRTVKAKRLALMRGAVRGPNVLKSAGTCKPEGELFILKSN